MTQLLDQSPRGILLSFFIICTGCTPYYAPGVNFRNMSDDKIHNIDCVWVGHGTGRGVLFPGQSATELFYIRQRQDYFGQVSLTWENAKGQHFSRSFEATPETFPLLAEPFDTLSGFSFYFTQDDVDYLIGKKWEDSEEELRRGTLMNHIRIDTVNNKKKP